MRCNRAIQTDRRGEWKKKTKIKTKTTACADYLVYGVCLCGTLFVRIFSTNDDDGNQKKKSLCWMASYGAPKNVVRMYAHTYALFFCSLVVVMWSRMAGERQTCSLTISSNRQHANNFFFFSLVRFFVSKISTSNFVWFSIIENWKENNSFEWIERIDHIYIIYIIIVVVMLNAGNTIIMHLTIDLLAVVVAAAATHLMCMCVCVHTLHSQHTPFYAMPLWRTKNSDIFASPNWCF